MLREEVFEQLLATGGERSAFRYAACGLADSACSTGDGVHVSPMGCGHRLCPRCGRQRGRPMINRIFQWLAAAPHQDIFSVCLTQKVIRGERLAKARVRMREKEAEYLAVLKERGLISGASCAHIVWSVPGGGWHYHVHLLLELPAASWDSDELLALWKSVAAPEVVQIGADGARLVVAAGPADPSVLGNGVDPDFWSDSKGGLAAAVQYPVRDIAQGISAVRCGGDRERVRECVAVLLKHAKGWKLRRTYGQWRKKAPPLPEPTSQPVEITDNPAKKAACPGSPAQPVRLGTIHRLSRMAAKGDRQARGVFRLLELSSRNDTEFGKRFVAFCRAAAGSVDT
jgi:hypothetical protein